MQVLNDKDIQEIVIYKDSSDNIFNTDKKYKIPLYQREFAWGDRQITQLLEDIRDCSSEKYYIGTLVVSDDGKYYEVVDGQQRLTALFLLLSVLGKEFSQNLKYACRAKSEFTLENISNIISGKDVDEDGQKQQSMCLAIQSMEDFFRKEKISKEEFSEKLANVVIYRIIVPPHTDLNRYFETMNIRGEQLEQHDILKATLMSSYGTNEGKKNVFASIWEACSDMNGYVQMNFDTSYRKCLFGEDWGKVPDSNSFNSFCALISDRAKSNPSSKSIIDVVNGYIPEESYTVLNEHDGAETKVRFEGIIDFPYFLLHCLKIFVHKLGISEGIVGSLLDDKKLADTFDKILTYDINLDRETFADQFILHMLKVRMLYDMYIIKREYASDSVDGEWSLKTLKRLNKRSSKNSPYFVNTSFPEPISVSANFGYSHDHNLMIQSALRVSFTSPKVMHWITALLEWIENDDNRSSLRCYCEQAERHAIENINKNFFEACSDGVYRMGVKTPHIVFNYLDYLLWKKDKDSREDKYKDFVFEFRNSVEHWYPRNPSESELKPWNDGGVDRFGNLCLIQRSVNSKFSNLKPEGKKISYSKSVNKGSIKLRLMAEVTKSDEEATKIIQEATNNIEVAPKSGSILWKEKGCPDHEKEMINVLKEACGYDKKDAGIDIAIMVGLS